MLKKGTPGKGGGGRTDSFSYTSVQFGLSKNWYAWMAGEPYWCEEAHEHTERDPGTKPCLHWITDGAVACRRCRAGRPTRCIGWVPLYREEDLRPVVVIVHETASDLLKGLHWPDYVRVGRVDAKSSAFVRASDSGMSLLTDIEERKRPVDITRDLLVMWRMPELNEWLASRGRPAAAAPETPPALRQRLSVPPPTTTTEALAIDAERRAGDGAGVFGATADEVVKRIKARIEKNGKPHTEEEGTT